MVKAACSIFRFDRKVAETRDRWFACDRMLRRPSKLFCRRPGSMLQAVAWQTRDDTMMRRLGLLPDT